MTSADRNDDLSPAQEKKLEWVTPKISLMGAENTEGTKTNTGNELPFGMYRYYGPS